MAASINPEERRAALKLIVSEPNSRNRSSRRPRVADNFPIVVPEVKLICSQVVDYYDFECEAMGVTYWQRTEAWRLLSRHRDDQRFAEVLRLMTSHQRIWDYLETVLSQERRFIVAMMLEHYPAAGRKLLKSLQPKDGPWCRVHRRKRKKA